jgi:hypothetical protein
MGRSLRCIWLLPVGVLDTFGKCSHLQLAVIAGMSWQVPQLGAHRALVYIECTRHLVRLATRSDWLLPRTCSD